MSCPDVIFGVLILFVIIIIILVGGALCAISCNTIGLHPWGIKDTFKSVVYGKLGYADYDKDLESALKNNSIGEPPGVLEIDPDQTSCDTTKNILIQPDVSFRQDPLGSKGCTTVNKRWPE